MQSKAEQSRAERRTRQGKALTNNSLACSRSTHVEKPPGTFWQIDDAIRYEQQMPGRGTPLPSIHPSPCSWDGWFAQDVLWPTDAHGCPPPEMQPRHPLLSQRRGRPQSPGMGEQYQWMDVSTRTTQKHPSRSSSTNICKHQDEAPAWIPRMSSVAPQRRWTVGLLDCVLHALELTRPALPCSPLLWNWEVILSVPKSSRGWPMGNGKGNRLLETARRDNETRKKKCLRRYCAWLADSNGSAHELLDVAASCQCRAMIQAAEPMTGLTDVGTYLCRDVRDPSFDACSVPMLPFPCSPSPGFLQPGQPRCGVS